MVEHSPLPWRNHSETDSLLTDANDEPVAYFYERPPDLPLAQAIANRDLVREAVNGPRVSPALRDAVHVALLAMYRASDAFTGDQIFLARRDELNFAARVLKSALRECDRGDPGPDPEFIDLESERDPDE